jgi:hypothetical protein
MKQADHDGDGSPAMAEYNRCLKTLRSRVFDAERLGDVAALKAALINSSLLAFAVKMLEGKPYTISSDNPETIKYQPQMTAPRSSTAASILPLRPNEGGRSHVGIPTCGWSGQTARFRSSRHPRNRRGPHNRRASPA